MISYASRNPFLPTQFAPAERLSGAEVHAQARKLDAEGGIQHLIDTIPGLVAVLNSERQIVLANAAWHKLAHQLGKPVLAGLRTGEFFSCPWSLVSEGGCGTADACRNCGSTKAVLEALEGRGSTCEARISTLRDGQYDFRTTASPFMWDGRRYVLMILADISEEKRRQSLDKFYTRKALDTIGCLAERSGTPALTLAHIAGAAC